MDEQPTPPPTSLQLSLELILWLIAAIALAVWLINSYLKPSTTVEAKSVAAPAVKADANAVETHVRIKDLPNADENKYLIGFQHEGNVFLDASSFCEQPNFRPFADMDGKIQSTFEHGALIATPDIAIPARWRNTRWFLLSENNPPELFRANASYQWLNYAHGPVNGACLFFGALPNSQATKAFSTQTAQPVIGVLTNEQADLRLEEHGEIFAITEENKSLYSQVLPWLDVFKSTAPRCNDSDPEPPSVWVLPFRTRITAGSEERTHWFVNAGCDLNAQWALAMTADNDTTVFIKLKRPILPYDYWPVKIWTVDVDGDGSPEFLVQAQYYEGLRHVLLKLSTDEQSKLVFTEIAASAYEGI